jgi:hypothetical protein
MLVVVSIQVVERVLPALAKEERLVLVVMGG